MIDSKAFAVAGVVLVLTVTPSIVEANKAWNESPSVRPFLIGWYLFAGVVAVSAWRQLQ